MDTNPGRPVNLTGKKILLANFAGDGHFNPLTGLAVHLKYKGADVRWYTSGIYAEKIKKLGIEHYPFRKALDINGENIEEVFPDRAKIRGQVKKLNHDMIYAFILRSPEFYEDLLDIQKEFPFELLVADCAFTGIPYVTDKMNIPVIAVGVFPLTETSRDLPPAGLGMTPSFSFPGKMKQAALRFIANKILFGKSGKVMNNLLKKYGISPAGENVFDLVVKKSTLFLQSGTPAFEYHRSDLGKNIRFIGPLLPYSAGRKKEPWFDQRLNLYESIVVVTQGTVEKDYEKLLVPSLEALKNTDVLVIVTTGGSGTEELRKRYQGDNIIIEDFIPFGDIMPYANAYITNGGYGGVMLGIQHELPLVVAGVHEGKNEINARVGYFKIGINLKTEKPAPSQVRDAVYRILNDKTYKQNVMAMARDFSHYSPGELCAQYVDELLTGKTIKTASIQPLQVSKSA